MYLYSTSFIQLLQVFAPATKLEKRIHFRGANLKQGQFFQKLLLYLAQNYSDILKLDVFISVCYSVFFFYFLLRQIVA